VRRQTETAAESSHPFDDRLYAFGRQRADDRFGDDGVTDLRNGARVLFCEGNRALSVSA
jgi:hypothetical protein